ncbi:MAG: MazG nucleotide pyrophosphohydrolase domain-containing protein [bacterium]
MKKQKYTFSDLLKIVSKLRSIEGCAWDRKQTHKSLIPYLKEETQEFVHAVKLNNHKEMADELGDILLQIVFHAQLGREKDLFTIDDVIQNICRKLIRRHPHVFGNLKTRDIKVIIRNWNKIKAAEKRQKFKN